MNLDNLKLLRDWLKAGNITQDQFDMGTYRGKRIPNNNKPLNLIFVSKDSCGTLGCLLGWCPFVPGLEVTSRDYVSAIVSHDFVFFPDYGKRLFGVKPHQKEYLFDGRWESFDNTLAGAIERLDYFIENKGENLPELPWYQGKKSYLTSQITN